MVRVGEVYVEEASECLPGYLKYIRNDILKPFKVKILRYTERVHEIHNPAKYLPPPQMKRQSVTAANWNVRKEEFSTSDLRLAIKDGLPKYMRDELDDHLEDYCSLTYEYWFNLLSTIQVKYESKGAAVHINNISSAGAASLYDSNKSVRIPNKKKAKTGVLCSNKLPKKTYT